MILPTLPFAALFLPLLYEVVFLALLLFIGIVIIVIIADVLLFMLPAAIIGVVVWLLTGSLFWAGVAFVLVALISLVRS